jgi:hypothetical protein
MVHSMMRNQTHPELGIIAFVRPFTLASAGFMLIAAPYRGKG